MGHEVFSGIDLDSVSSLCTGVMSSGRGSIRVCWSLPVIAFVRVVILKTNSSDMRTTRPRKYYIASAYGRFSIESFPISTCPESQLPFNIITNFSPADEASHINIRHCAAVRFSLTERKDGIVASDHIYILCAAALQSSAMIFCRLAGRTYRY